MTDLIVCLASNHLPHLQRLINEGQWESIFIIASAKHPLAIEKNAKYIIATPQQPIHEYIEYIVTQLTAKITGFEVALSLVSGSGKEHMALQSALLSLPVGVRFTALTKEGVVML